MVKTLPAVKKDYNALADFFSEIENNQSSRETWLNRFFFWWDNNPAFNENLKRGWVLKDNGKIVGFLGIIATYFQLAKEKKLIFNGTTWVVAEKYRGEPSLDLMLAFIDYTKESMLFDITSTGYVSEIKEKLGFKKIYARKGVRVYYLIIDPCDILQEKFSCNWFSKTALKLFIPIVRLYRFFITYIINQSKEFYEVKQVDHVDNSFDYLWEEKKSSFDNTNVRTSEVIRWYCSKIGANTNILFGCYSNKKLLGYMVCKTEDSLGTIKRKVTIMDIWGPIKDDKFILSMIRKSLTFSIENNYHAVFFPVFSIPFLRSTRFN